MKKKIVLLFALLLTLFCSLSLADGPVLCFTLPENAIMIENVDFGDGEFIETYQLPDGTVVQNLRFMTDTLTLDELIIGDWATCSAVADGEISEISGCPAESRTVTQRIDAQGYPAASAQDAGVGEIHIELVAAHPQGCTLVMQIILPEGADEQTAKSILNSLQIGGAENSDAIVG